MKRRIWLFIAIIAVVSILTVSIISCINVVDGDVVDVFYNNLVSTGSVFDIRSPYMDVDWGSYNHYKAGLHMHTTNSDGSNTMEEMLARHYELDYDIVGITDHVWKGTEGRRQRMNLVTRTPTQTTWTGPGDYPRPVGTYTTQLSYITQARVNEFAAGTAVTPGLSTPRGRGMVILPGSAEFALEVGGEEMNVFFFNGNAPPGWSTNLRGGIQIAHNAGAVFFINHPGRTTVAMNYPEEGSAGNGQGANSPSNPSNENRWIRKYADLFMEFPITSLAGLEVFNRRDQDSRHDRVLWDNVLTRVIPHGRFVWGFGNDDAHSTSPTSTSGGINTNYNVFVMPSNTTSNFRNAMVNGQFYVVTVVGFNEGVDILTASTVTRPSITSITFGENDDTITISAKDVSNITWISEGQVILTDTGTENEGIRTFTIDLADSAHVDDVGVYVRANLIGPGGMALIQPIATTRR